MKQFYLLAAVMVLILPSLAIIAQTDKTADEQIMVKRVVEDYLSKRDPEAVRRALSGDAKIISVDGRGKIVVTLISKPAKLMPDGFVVYPEQRIAAIDITEGGATVKVESEFPAYLKTAVTPHKHVQYISLLKAKGEWKIVSILMPPLRFTETASK